MPQSFASLHIHIVFSTKHREPTLVPEIRPRLHEVIGGILREHSSTLIAAGGTADHIHLLASLGRTISISDALRFIKSNSSNWIHNQIAHMADFQWQEGYGAFAVSYSNIDAVKAYLANQQRHHQQLSFQDELRELLRHHEIEWDERYIWD